MAGWCSKGPLTGRFVLIYAVIYVIHVGVVRLCQLFGLSAYAGGLVAIAPVALKSFVLKRALVFIGPSPRRSEG